MNKDKSLFKSITRLSLGTGTILMIPLIAMQFTDEVVWTLSDFIVMGALIFSTGLTYILITQVLAPSRADKIVYRSAVGFALFTGFFLIWVNLAVGIIGSEANPINLFYFGVIAVGLIGAFIVRFQPDGMALTMYAMATAQALVAVIALIGDYYQSPPGTVVQIMGVNGFFIALFVLSALFFRHAAREQLSSKERVKV